MRRLAPWLLLAAMLVIVPMAVAGVKDDGVTPGHMWGSNHLKVGHKNILNGTIDCQKFVVKLRARVCGPLPTTPGQPGGLGPAGPTGPAGKDGGKGDTGAKGATGATGATGARGYHGWKGERGPKGDKGDPGQDGKDGASGDLGDYIVVPACEVGNSIHPGTCADNDNGDQGTDVFVLKAKPVS